MLASALIGLLALIIGSIFIWFDERRPRRSTLDDLRARNAELERRVAEIETRLASIGRAGA
jgi:hypothetical protein